MNAYRRVVPVLSAALLISSGLAGCAGATGSAPTPTVTVTTTATVTATPEPVVVARSYDDELTEFDAWLLCSGATYGQYHESSTIFPYSPDAASGGATLTDKGDGTFEVLVPFAPSSGDGFGAESICVAGGTIGDPFVELQGGRDFG